jgi:hypothetical protein
MWDHFPNLQKLASNPARFKRYVLEEIRQLEDCLWVDRSQGELCGALYYSYYYEYRYAFVTFVVSTVPWKTRSFLWKAMVEYLKVNHPECIAIVGEMEDPRFISNRERRVKARKRIHFFCRHGGRVLRGAAYMQPKLKPTSKGKEIPLVVLYFPLSNKATVKRSISKKEYERILEFIYESLYGDAFWGKPSYQAYCRYLNNLKKRMLTRSKNRITLGASIE